MSINVRKIENGIIVGSNTGENRSYVERAFPADSKDWDKNAKEYIAKIKKDVADAMEQQTIAQIDEFKKQLSAKSGK